MKNILMIMVGAGLLLACATAALADNSEAVCHTPPSHDFTIHIDHHAVPAHLAHGDYLGDCIDEDPNSTTTTTLENPDCYDIPIERDPATLKWANEGFRIHGKLTPPDPNTPVDGIGITLETVPDGIFLGAGCILTPVRHIRDKWRCTSGETRAIVRKRTYSDGTVSFPFKVRHYGWKFAPTTPEIKTHVSFICNGGENTAVWTGTLGKILVNRF